MLDAVLLMPNPDLGIGGIAIADPSSSFPAALAREFVRDLTLFSGRISLPIPVLHFPQDTLGFLQFTLTSKKDLGSGSVSKRIEPS